MLWGSWKSSNWPISFPVQCVVIYMSYIKLKHRKLIIHWFFVWPQKIYIKLSFKLTGFLFVFSKIKNENKIIIKNIRRQIDNKCLLSFSSSLWYIKYRNVGTKKKQSGTRVCMRYEITNAHTCRMIHCYAVQIGFSRTQNKWLND